MYLRTAVFSRVQYSIEHTEYRAMNIMGSLLFLICAFINFKFL
jgi:hypothetical protein